MTAYANLADFLNLAGRSREALSTAQEGLAQTPLRLRRNYDWMTLTVSEQAFVTGDWKAAREHAGLPAQQLAGLNLIYALLRDAELALGEGDTDRAAAALDDAEPLVRVSSEAQWHGLFGALRAELHRREGDLDGARRDVAHALDELETCTEDVMRIARVTAVGLTVEADRAQRARDIGEASDERDALVRARIHMQRLRAAAQSGGPVERAWREFGTAELRRARGRNDPEAWAKSVAAWRALERPYPVAIALHRQAEALVEGGERAQAAIAAAAALEITDHLGAGWLGGELRGLVDRGRLTAPAADRDGSGAREQGAGSEDPFGLTPRERQVLALVAQGATNRQIGASLYMAEKTASGARLTDPRQARGAQPDPGRRRRTPSAPRLRAGRPPRERSAAAGRVS